MPCRDDYPVPSATEYANDAAKAATARVKRRLEPLLCEAMKLLNVYDPKWKSHATPALAKWWNNHQKKDQARLKKETKLQVEKQLKEKALAKLSAKEKKVLGLK